GGGAGFFFSAPNALRLISANAAPAVSRIIVGNPHVRIAQLLRTAKHRLPTSPYILICGWVSSGAISREERRRKRDSRPTATAVRPAQSPHQRPITPCAQRRPRTTATGSPTM